MGVREDQFEQYDELPAYQEVIIKFLDETAEEQIADYLAELGFPRQGPEMESWAIREDEPTQDKWPPGVEVERSFDAAPELLDDLQARARESWEHSIPRLSRFWHVRIPAPLDKDQLRELLEQISVSEIVEYVTLAPPPGPPPAPDFLEQQTYLLNQGGVGVQCAWDAGATGADVRVCDCEYGFLILQDEEAVVHKDLPDIEVLSNRDNMLTKLPWHGAATLGILGAKDNDEGVTGIVHETELFFASESGGHRVDCLNDVLVAVADGVLRPGDVVLLEMQTWHKRPAEDDRRIHTVVKTLVGLGVVVVAAAGNAGKNLDEMLAWWLEAGSMEDVALWGDDNEEYDSGAILVGAGYAPCTPSQASRAAMGISNYGRRVDCQGWGNHVVSIGPCDLYNTQDIAHCYSKDYFGNTSSAAAMVAGVVAALQGYAKDQEGSPWSPIKIRQLLRDESLGTLQPFASKETNPIGPLPNLCKLLELVDG